VPLATAVEPADGPGIAGAAGTATLAAADEPVLARLALAGPDELAKAIGALTLTEDLDSLPVPAVLLADPAAAASAGLASPGDFAVPLAAWAAAEAVPVEPGAGLATGRAFGGSAVTARPTGAGEAVFGSASP
jgi:hypothetical protein